MLKLGYTTFERPETVHTDSTLHSLGDYLRRVAEQSRKRGPWKRPLEFDVMLGNYYQIWSWFRSGQIDAAVVSPFMAILLQRDTQVIPLLEFSEQGDPAGHEALIAASGRASTDPVQGFKLYLAEVLAVAKAGSLTGKRSMEEVAKLRTAYRVNLVSHLSSSGFVMPSLYAKQWLESQRPDDDVQNRFWHLFFENMRLTLAHGITPAQTSLTEFYFSYDGRTERRRLDEAAANGLGKWQKYAPSPFVPGEPSIPNDVLVVRRQVVTDALRMENTDRGVLGEYLTTGSMQTPFQSQRGSYTGVRWFNNSIHGRFLNEVNRLFSRVAPSSLAERNDRWYQRGLFDFTIGETMAFLRQDQENSNHARLSLVLSGGGVKSLYQTVLLDHLYGLEGRTPTVRNFDEGPDRLSGPTPRNSHGPMTVHTIIGTSGGAMLAFFAAQLPEVSASLSTLTAILSRTAALPLFPLVDLARIASVMLLLWVLVLLCTATRIFNWFGYRATAQPVEQTGRRWTGVAGAALLAAAAAVIVLTRSEQIEAVPGIEGALFGLTALGVHLWITCVGRATPEATPDPTAGRLALVTILFGALLVLVAVAVRFLLGSGPNAAETIAKFPLSLAASAGVFGVVIGLLGAAAAGPWGLGIRRVREYAAALFVVAVFIIVAYVPVVLLSWLEWASLLELTTVFWLTLGLSGVGTAVLLLWLSRRYRARVPLFELGLVSLMRNRTGPITTTLGGTLLSVAAWSFCLWVAVIAPALYGNAEALHAMRGAITQEELQTNRFRTNLIVTGSLLNDVQCGQEQVRQGGVYFCFEGAEGCGSAHRGQWQVFRRPSPARAVDAVFASGSAFPVFPQHLAHLPNGCEVRLVDGGYAHNVPLEAAVQAESRQVLILNASPDPTDTAAARPSALSRFLARVRLDGSQLITNSPKLLSFMFNRAQELDRNVGAGMVVASIAPRPADGSWPFLLDFRKTVRERMIETAKNDIEQDHRIGHVLSWGRPTTLTRIGTAPSDLASPPAGWSPAAAKALNAALAETGEGRIAAFDLDNTCLQGDIGEAMFLKMVVELRYDGANEAFWRLIPDASARAKLREYWTRFKKQESKRSYTQPVTWGADFTDYVVLFLRQYEHLENGPGGASEAYPWVVRLLSGLPTDEAAKMAIELWNQEMLRPIQPVTLRSAAFGVKQIEGGVRVRQEFKRAITDLQQKGWQVWIVSASNVFAVQAAARALGVPADRVLAMTPKTTNNVITSQLNEPVPYREGKRELLERLGLKPLLAAGDSMTDLEMLQASRTVIVVDRKKITGGDLRPNWILEQPTTFRLESPSLSFK